MARRTRQWVPWLLVLGLLVGLWRLGSWLFGAGELAGTDQLVNQFWIERVPRNDRDRVLQLALIRQDDKRVGFVARASRWQLHVDGFVWGQEGDRLRARFPQTGQRLQAQARTWPCKGEAPRPFELCLELRREGQVVKLFSMREWVIRPRADSFEAPAELPLPPGWETLLRGPAEPVGDGPENAGASPLFED
jgi:hypothetical protein